ncbi:sulfatase family protein [Roseiconus lacunae]|uniref:Arylsulfatase n=1 Tax=Roseiconus lacunae TaxID=2605694 RepID=A0ABT7PC77_9BACT|nr:arylsulfatase [Roseiconus lacunae]MDM4014092.1 arylsulfatase [Roseiconus lacunae]
MAVLLSVFACTVKASDRPNVIIVYTDDQGFGDCSALNPDSKFKTPHLDRLAEQGVLFTNAHSSDSVCTPSRYGLLTGRYAWRTTLKRGVMNAEGKCLIKDHQQTIASFLRDQGYATAMVGKWHLGMDFPGTGPQTRDWTKPVQDMPLDKGFDYFFGIPASLNYGVLAWFEGRHAKVPPTLFTAKKPNQRHVDYRIKPPYQDTPEQTRKALGKRGMEVAPDFVDNQCLTRFTDKTIEWIRSHQQNDQDKPFFVYLPLTSPHYPVCPLPKYHGQGECGGYGEFMIETDDHLGRLMAYLDQAGLADDTIVCVTSDNGPENSWKQRIKDFGHRSNLHFRDGKRSVYEGGHRVPMIIRWPAGIQSPGRRCDALVGQIDLFATLADLLGQPIDNDQAPDSQSFASALSDPAAKHQRLPLINHGIKGRFSVTEGDWKLVFPHSGSGIELYQLANDPSETKDVAEANPRRVDTLRQKATRIVVDGRTTQGPRLSNDTGYWPDLTWISETQYADGR